MTNEERIKADAEAYATGIGDVYRKYAAQYGYIAGATAVHDRAQGLVDALEAIAGITMPVPNKADMIEIAKKHLEQWKGKEFSQWQPIAAAPKDGSTIEIAYDNDGKEKCLARWSDNPICMLGPRNGSFPPGWATPPEADCDVNLPLDPPLMWRPIN